MLIRSRYLQLGTRHFIVTLCALVLSACGGARTTTSLSDTTTFAIQGNPEAAGGATWHFRDVVDGTQYDLTGVLLKPPGPGPFPAVLLSHGSDGSAALLASLLGPTMVQWGLVCIATNYTHATGVPIGAPGDASAPG